MLLETYNFIYIIENVENIDKEVIILPQSVLSKENAF